ncbi:hypothetical protein GC101_14670 [Paenibacillus sp. LMG 31459]|uniref:DUF4352 domain-containing protein n=1 Tax=Paenibacillus phytohabitans TaxID=2654978 RepID=A0ABX1YGH1_9BACL|nr:hypothetical protein [Paenibacillus phytohabitans]NOU80112.1 hypothetical protein [Paenibacillus phytohabitans]
MKKTMLSKTMMGRTAVKAILATALLAGGIVGQVGAVSATAAKPTAAPIMRDNLSKYGLVKDVELPVTVEAGGLSYTLEKIMIYDFNSKDAQGLIKRFNYSPSSGMYLNPKSMIWTKIIIKNNSKKTIDNFDGKSKWSIQTADFDQTDPIQSWSKIGKTNDKEALNAYKLKPGESLSTYQAYYYTGKFDYLAIRIFYAGDFSEKYMVLPAELREVK